MTVHYKKNSTHFSNLPVETWQEVRKDGLLPEMICYPTIAAINGYSTFHLVFRMKIVVAFV